MTDEESASLWQGYNAKIVVIKHGMKGSTAYTCDGQKFSIKPFPVEARKGFGGGDSVHAGNITREDIRELYHGHRPSGGGCGGKIAVRRHAVRTGELFSVYDTGR